jgi:hypothetical protein
MKVPINFFEKERSPARAHRKNWPVILYPVIRALNKRYDGLAEPRPLEAPKPPLRIQDVAFVCAAESKGLTRVRFVISSLLSWPLLLPG